jgi:hypothetical protein
MPTGRSKKTDTLELYRTHQLLACADAVKSLGENTNIIKKHIEALQDASKEEAGLGVMQRKLNIF